MTQKRSSTTGASRSWTMLDGPASATPAAPLACPAPAITAGRGARNAMGGCGGPWAAPAPAWITPSPSRSSPPSRSSWSTAATTAPAPRRAPRSSAGSPGQPPSASLHQRLPAAAGVGAAAPSRPPATVDPGRIATVSGPRGEVHTAEPSWLPSAGRAAHSNTVRRRSGRRGARMSGYHRALVTLSSSSVSVRVSSVRPPSVRPPLCVQRSPVRCPRVWCPMSGVQCRVSIA